MLIESWVEMDQCPVVLPNWLVSWFDSFHGNLLETSWIKRYSNRRSRHSNGLSFEKVIWVQITWPMSSMRSAQSWSMSRITIVRFSLSHELNRINPWENHVSYKLTLLISWESCWLMKWIDSKLSQGELIRFKWSWVVPKSSFGSGDSHWIEAKHATLFTGCVQRNEPVKAGSGTKVLARAVWLAQ